MNKFFFLLYFIFSSLKIYGTPKIIEDSTIQTRAGKHYNRNYIYTLLAGRHYRKVWNTTISSQIIDINKINGGLTLLKAGGDLQSISFKLKDSLENEYVLKMVDKDQSKFLPKILRKSFIGWFTRDQTSSLNPYAESILSPLNKIIYDVDMHSTLYFVPQGTILENNLKNIKGRLGYFSPQLNENDSIRIIKTEKFLEERFAENQYIIDSLSFAKQRLFDFLIGDFDRHRDQWIWVYNKKNKILKPIAKDHDMAFSKFRDGIFPWVISKAQPILQQFNNRYRLKGLEKTGKYLDQIILTNLSRQDWENSAENLIKELSDSVLTNAVQNLPVPIFNLIGKGMIQTLKERRDQLKKISSEMYELLRKESLIVTSDKSERISITRMNNMDTQVRVYRVHKQKEKLLFSQVYKRSETKVIKIYSLGGNDEFKIEGDASKGIRIELYGGLQEDTYIENSKINESSKKTYIFDTKKGNKFILTSKTKTKLRRGSTKFNFEREGF